MSLSIALEQARSALTQQASRANVTSTNIVNAQNPGYHRRTQQVSSGDAAGLSYITIREANAALERQLLTATARSAESSARAETLSQIPALLTDPGSANSLPARFSALNSALLQFTSEPSSEAYGRAVISAASGIADEIRLASEQITAARNSVNQKMTDSAVTINDLLADLAKTETQMKLSASSGSGQNDLMDKRDQILESLAQIISIRVVTKSDQSISVYTDSGIVLYDRLPREVSTVSHFDPGSGGNVTDLMIDGMDATSPNSIMPIKSGAIYGLIQSRDQILQPASVQLDEMTRVLVDAFADTDRNDPATLPKIQGLFVIQGSNGDVPTSYVVGIASKISINDRTATEPNAVALLRNGGLGQPANTNYNHNSSGLPGFQDHLNKILANFNGQATFQVSGMINNSGTLESYSADAAAWINEISKSNLSNQQAADTTKTYIHKQLSDKVGVNLDDETVLMLDIQHSYQVAGKLISILDEMFNTLLNRLN